MNFSILEIVTTNFFFLLTIYFWCRLVTFQFQLYIFPPFHFLCHFLTNVSSHPHKYFGANFNNIIIMKKKEKLNEQCLLLYWSLGAYLLGVSCKNRFMGINEPFCPYGVISLIWMKKTLPWLAWWNLSLAILWCNLLLWVPYQNYSKIFLNQSWEGFFFEYSILELFQANSKLKFIIELKSLIVLLEKYHRWISLFLVGL